MSLPTRWNPFRQMSRFEPFTNFEDFFRDLGVRQLSRQFENTLDMRMDVAEDDKAYRIAIDIPGARKEDIDVSVEGNQVTISVEVKREESRESAKDICSERYSGKAYRSFSLPSEVDTAKAEARYDSGVLSLSLPKTAATASKHLSIN